LAKLNNFHHPQNAFHRGSWQSQDFRLLNSTKSQDLSEFKNLDFRRLALLSQN
jgi:hypothetical protein